MKVLGLASKGKLTCQEKVEYHNPTKLTTTTKLNTLPTRTLPSSCVLYMRTCTASSIDLDVSQSRATTRIYANRARRAHSEYQNDHLERARSCCLHFLHRTKCSFHNMENLIYICVTRRSNHSKQLQCAHAQLNGWICGCLHSITQP